MPDDKKAVTRARRKNIYQRISAVMGDLEAVQRDGKVSFGGGYTFASHDAVMAAVRPLLIREGIVMRMSLESHAVEGNRLEATYSVRFTSIDDPSDFIEDRFVGFGIDQGDKGPGKVLSYIKKYAILITFGLSTGDDVDGHDTKHEPAVRNATPRVPEPPKRKSESSKGGITREHVANAAKEAGHNMKSVAQLLRKRFGVQTVDALDPADRVLLMEILTAKNEDGEPMDLEAASAKWEEVDEDGAVGPE